MEHVPKEILDDKYLITFSAGDEIMPKSAFDSTVYFILDGIVKVLKYDDNNAVTTVWFAKEKDVIGIELINGPGQKPHQILAKTDGAIYGIPYENFEAQLETNAAFSNEVLAALCTRVNDIQEHAINILHSSTRQRLVKVILDLCEINSRFEKEYHGYQIEDMATLIGTTPSYLYKLLLEFTGKGLIKIRNNKLKMVNKERLLALLSSEAA